MKTYIFACVLAVSVAAAACVGFDHSTSVTTPTTSSGTNLLAGTWQSVQDATGTIIPDPNTCTNFKWVATSQTATSAAGSFSATCNGVAFTGTASGTLSGTSVAWSANGTATGSPLPQSPCNISLTGTAELGTDSIRVPYSGTTCMGIVAGVQILNRK